MLSKMLMTLSPSAKSVIATELLGGAGSRSIWDNFTPRDKCRLTTAGKGLRNGRGMGNAPEQRPGCTAAGRIRAGGDEPLACPAQALGRGSMTADML